MSVSIAVTGAGGRMGQAILTLAMQDAGFKVTGLLERPGHAMIGLPAAAAFPVKVTAEPREALKGAQVLIDFTKPEPSLQCLKAAEEAKVAMVIGTTGFSAADRKAISDAARNIPIVQSYNMSVGMNLLFSLVEEAAALLGETYDIEIIEAHHKMKADAPSGSALRLGEGVAKAWGKKLVDLAVHGREGKVGERKKGTVGFHSVRGGDIVGDHTVLFAGPSEHLELKHVAHNRDIFAQGALRAAAWLAGKPAGLYDMWDVLGLKK